MAGWRYFVLCSV